MADRLRAIPGVARAYPRIVEMVRIPIEGLLEPATGQIVSLPDEGEPPLNGLHLSAGRALERGDADQVLVGAAFAEHHHLKVGGTLTAIIDGTLRDLHIAGFAASPEFVYSVAPGSIVADDHRFTPLWMVRSTVAPAFRLEGAFNDVVFELESARRRGAARERDHRPRLSAGGAGRRLSGRGAHQDVGGQRRAARAGERGVQA